MYPVMIPFLDIGTDQLAERAVGEPRTGDNKKFDGDDGAENDNDSQFSQQRSE